MPLRFVNIHGQSLNLASNLLQNLLTKSTRFQGNNKGRKNERTVYYAKQRFPLGISPATTLSDKSCYLSGNVMANGRG